MNVWPEVIKDMIDRNEMGAQKYGRYLRDDCPDDMLQHLYEELLDASVYIKTLMLQRETTYKHEAYNVFDHLGKDT